MTGIYGGWLTTPACEPKEVLAAMLDASANNTASTGLERHIDSAGYAIAGNSIASTATLAAITGQVYWSDSELQQLANEQSDARAVAQAYQQYGKAFLDYLHGVFVLALLDKASKRLFIAVDRIGIHSLYYAHSTQGLVFASTAKAVCAHPAITVRLSQQDLFNYVYFHMVPSPGCIFAGVEKLSGGHVLEYNTDSHHAAVNSYWQPTFNEASNSIAELADELKSVLAASVQRALAATDTDSGAFGAFLSGGLDSSTVSGMLAKLQPEHAKTFSIGFDAKGYDEIEYARIAVAHFNTRQYEYYVTPEDVVASIPEIARSYDEPFGNSSAVPTYYCAKLAADNGVNYLLAGDGGDELFAGNTRYAKQGVFEYYQHLPTMLQGILKLGAGILPSRLPLLSKAKSYINQAKVPLPDRLQSYNYLHRIAIETIFTTDFLTAIDSQWPLQRLREYYTLPDEASTLNRMLYSDWQLILADNDIRKVSQMCAVNGVEVAYPMLDEELVEFSCRVPSAIKLKRGQLRHFYKQALQDFLPTEIINKSKHGFGLPFGVWMSTHSALQELAYDSLLSLKQRACFRADFIDQAIELHRNEHAKYYGELVWVLMMLELWWQNQDL